MKELATDLTQVNVQAVMQLLRESPARLEALTRGLSAKKAARARRPGERSLTQIVAHLLNTEMRDAEAIYLALLANEPRLHGIHAEGGYGNLLRYDLQPLAELVAYFGFRRRVLMRVLEGLNDKQWARSVRTPGKRRKESVYWRARVIAMHEREHLREIEAAL